jgi:small GTP-binding protein
MTPDAKTPASWPSAFAVLTPPGRGGIAVIRCIGPGAEAAIARCFRPARAQRQPLPGCLAYGHIVDAEGRALDEVILHRDGPAAFEVNCHGGPAAVKTVCDRLTALGLAAADADRLLELEGLPRIARQARRALRAATTSLAARILLDQLNGSLAAAIGEIVAGLAPSLAPGECTCLAPRPFSPLPAVGEGVGVRGGAPLDPSPGLRPPSPARGEGATLNAYGEYTGGGRAADAPSAAPPPPPLRGGSPHPPRPQGARGPSIAAGAAGQETRRADLRGAKYGNDALAGLPAEASAKASLDALLGRWRTCGRLLADPPRIAIAGRTNSGKSTLLNRLVGAERAITSPQPGTTRDPVEAEAALEGVPAVLVDTAGLREACGEIERAGVERARREAARAAVVVYLIDATEGVRPEDEAALDALGDRALAVWNKIDAVAEARPAKTGRGAPLADPSAGGSAGSDLRLAGRDDAEKGTVPFSQQREKGTAPFSARSAATRRGARDALAISALTGDGIPALVAELLARLGWRAPGPGEAVPFTAEQAAAIESAREALAAGRAEEARATLAALLR